jgi:hypothetical protein
MSSQVVFAFFAMLNFPLRQQVGAVGEASLDTIHVVFRDRLQNNSAKLIFQKLDLGARLNSMFAAQLCRDD